MVVLKWAVLEGAASPLPSPADRAKLPAYGKNRGAVMSKLAGGLIQMGLKAPTDKSPEEIPQGDVGRTYPADRGSGKEGRASPLFPKVFTQPYFCPSQDSKWYAAAERFPTARPSS